MEEKQIEKKNYLIIVSFILYLLLLTWIIIFKCRFSLDSLKRASTINFIPFKTNDIINGFHETFLNLLVFIPLGIYVKLVFKKQSIIKSMFFISAISLLYETTQYIFHIGISDITDVMMNSLGGLIGVVAITLLYKLFEHFVKDKENLDKILGIISIIGILMIILILIVILF